MDASRLISAAAAAAILGIDERHVRRLCRAGKIKHVQVGREWLVDSVRLADFQRHPTKGRPKVKAG